jgi:hypothetical protein
MSADVLAGLPEARVAAWYGRLAGKVGAMVKLGDGALPQAVAADGTVAAGELEYQGGSLAAFLLLHWLSNRDPSHKHVLKAPDHLRNDPSVGETLAYHRSVFLTEKKARLGAKGSATEKWAGIIPRLQGTPGFPRWDGKTALFLEYESLVELPLTLQVKALAAVWSGKVDPKDAGPIDLFFGLHGFQLKSKVQVAATAVPGSKALGIKFNGWSAQVRDRYDWDEKKHLTVPNPDFGSKAPWAVEPTSKTIEVYHKNAGRVERAGLAAPYDVETEPWKVVDQGITGPAEVDPEKNLSAR